jgi:ribosomal protein S18 acetylase RimI-like enzyme
MFSAKSMEIIIRKATEKDFFAILSLIKELAVFEKAPEKVTNSVEQMKNEKDFFQCYVAENDKKEIVGMVVFFFAYYTWVGKSLYLDDLYVKENYRGKQIGKKLLKLIFEIAKKENCKRVEFQVSSWNSRAIKMYKKCGADIDTESIVCKFDETKIKEFEL